MKIGFRVITVGLPDTCTGPSSASSKMPVITAVISPMIFQFPYSFCCGREYFEIISLLYSKLIYTALYLLMGIIVWSKR